MGARQWLNKNPHVATAATVALLLAALVVVLWQLSAGPSVTGEPEVFFWDMQADQPYAAPRATLPPAEAPSGGEGVRAHLFTCGECAPGEWFGYLETLTGSAQQRYEREGVEPGLDDWQVRDLDGQGWLDQDSAAGLRLIESYEDVEICGDAGDPPRACRP